MVLTRRISLQTEGHCDIIDITSVVAEQVSACEMNDGIVVVFLIGSTAGITTIENEPGLISDFKEMWGRLIPTDISYGHDQAWREGNGYSHLRASLLGAFLTIPFVNKTLVLGVWQQIILVDFDNRPRSREIVLQIIGE